MKFDEKKKGDAPKKTKLRKQKLFYIKGERALQYVLDMHNAIGIIFVAFDFFFTKTLSAYYRVALLLISQRLKLRLKLRLKFEKIRKSCKYNEEKNRCV